MVWELFYAASKKALSVHLMNAFLRWQIACSQVSSRFWFTDGHVLPYSGREKMHKIFNTKKRETEPGCINFVSCDISGKVVDFQIKEGGSGLHEHLINLHDKWEVLFEPENYPVHVFDREGDGHDFFYELIRRDCPFVTWEKNADHNKLYRIPETEFVHRTTVNSREYQFFEMTKIFKPKPADKHRHTFELRRFYIINTKTKKRTSALAFAGKTTLSQQDCIYAILNRWGASENTFKHAGSRQPTSYRPGFKLLKSQNQSIANPQIKAIQKEIKTINNKYNRVCKKLAKKEKVQNKSGQVRANDAYTNLKAEATELDKQKSELKRQKSTLPERIDVTGLQDYSCFKTHDNEGKNLFDFVATLVWNARKGGVEMLKQLYPFENDVVDLFYAIVNCHGTVQITSKEIIVTQVSHLAFP